MADLNKVYQEIEERVAALENVCSALEEAGAMKAAAVADYDLALAKAMANLAMGRVKSVGDIAIEGKPPATLIPKYAAGMCFEARATLEIAINRYKSITTKINVLSATLNAKQSLFRHIQ